MSNQITGKILKIGETITLTTKSGNMFSKREIIIDATRFDPYTGERGKQNTPALEFIGDRCQELDQYIAGQIVTITFDLEGKMWTGKDGAMRNITSVRGYKIELKNSTQSPQQISKQTQEDPLPF